MSLCLLVYRPDLADRGYINLLLRDYEFPYLLPLEHDGDEAIFLGKRFLFAQWPEAMVIFMTLQAKLYDVLRDVVRMIPVKKMNLPRAVAAASSTGGGLERFPGVV
jgi:hypothetical protein